MATNTNDLKKIRRKKKRQKFLKKLSIVFCISFFVLIAYVSRGKWIPLFDGILNKYHTTVVNDGELASGKFPLKIETSSDYDISQVDDNFAVLTDTYIFFYDGNGELVTSKQHGMSNPILKTANKRALLYDLGGYKLSVRTKLKTVYLKTLDDQIVFAQISKKGYITVVTKSDKYASMMTVYNEDGDKIFYSSSNEKIINVAFNSDSTGCIATSISAKGGQLVSKSSCYKFDKESKVWQSTLLPTLALSTNISPTGDERLVGNSQYNIISSKGEVTYTYIYKSDLVGFSTSNDITALVFNNMQLRKTTLALISGEDIPLEISLDGEFNNISVENNEIFVMTDTDLVAYTPDGQILATVALTKDYTDFIVIGDNIYLLGMSMVDRVNFKS